MTAASLQNADRGQRYVLGSSLAWSLISILLLENKRPVWPKYIIAWMLAAACDVTRLITIYTPKNAVDNWDTAHIAIQLLRVFFALMAVAYLAVVLKSTSAKKIQIDEETQSLLNGPATALPGQTSAAYGASRYRDNESDDGKDSDDGNRDNSDAGDDHEDDMNEDDKEKERIKLLSQKRLEETGWVGYLKGFMIFLPHLIPYKDRFTQFWLLVLLGAIGVDRVTTLLIPIQLAKIVDALTSYQGTGRLFWVPWPVPTFG